jgi:hypothetical protein
MGMDGMGVGERKRYGAGRKEKDHGGDAAPIYASGALSQGY